MPYKTPTQDELRRLLNRKSLERAMRERDVSGAELARLCDVFGVSTTRQTIANLRLGRTRAARSELARAIEHALAVKPGSLFEPEPVDEW